MIKYDRPLIIYIPIYLSIRSLGVKVVVLKNVVLLLDIMHYWLAAHRSYLAVCFGSVSFSVPPSLRLFILQRVHRFAAPLGLHRILDACVFKSPLVLPMFLRLCWLLFGGVAFMPRALRAAWRLRCNCTLYTPVRPRSAQR